MRVIENIRDMREYRRGITERTALVATLGGMHAGHEEHLVAAKKLASVTIGSLFLNPTQFSASEDLASYPQNRDADLGLFERHGTVAVFAPSPVEMYSSSAETTVDPGRIAQVLEGAHRPEHFRGVATIVAKLFSVIRPDVATFGEKDAQQLRIIENLNRDLNLGVEIARIPTVREPDGLALSSRNRYLTPAERDAAPALYESLRATKALWDAGERSVTALLDEAYGMLTGKPMISVDYVSVADRESFHELTETASSPAILLIAAKIGRARLIDNIVLD